MQTKDWKQEQKDHKRSSVAPFQTRANEDLFPKGQFFRLKEASKWVGPLRTFSLLLFLDISSEADEVPCPLQSGCKKSVVINQ